MLKIVDNKVYHDNQKIGWLEGSYVRGADGNKIGHVEGQYVYNQAEHKIAYIHENQLIFENGNHSIPLEKINEEVVGTEPLIMKCAVYVLFEE